MDALTIGQLGRTTDTKIETIRYYEKIGLLPAPRRTAGNYRSYTVEHLQRLGFIRRARELGFTIEDVRELLKLAGHGEKPCEEVDQLVARHLETNRAKDPGADPIAARTARYAERVQRRAHCRVPGYSGAISSACNPE